MGEDPIIGNKYYKPNKKRAAEKSASAKIRGQRVNSFNIFGDGRQIRRPNRVTPASTSAVSGTQKKAVIKGTATTSRSVGGISGLGSRKVNPIYKMMGR